MHFSLIGGSIQFGINSEGDTLWRAGLLEKCWKEGSVVGAEPTDLLRSLFRPMPQLEQLYPVLVEYVLAFKYSQHAGFSDAQEIARRLGELGLTADGLTTLRNRIMHAFGG